MMEKINVTLKVNSTSEYKEYKEQVINNIKSDPICNKFLEMNSLDDSFIQTHLVELKEMLDYNVPCLTCKGFSECVNKPKGYIKTIDLRNDNLIFTACKKCKQYQPLLSKYAIRDFEDKWLDSNLTSLINKPFNNKIKGMITTCVGTLTKGLYLYGKPGVGKSYIMAGIANEILISSNNKAAFINWKNFVDDIKSNFGVDDEYIKERINIAKEIDVLCIDDLGAEKFSEWSLYDLLNEIIDYRLHNNKLTLISSRYSLLELNRLYGTYDLRTKRLIEGIASLTEELEVTGINFNNIK